MKSTFTTNGIVTENSAIQASKLIYRLIQWTSVHSYYQPYDHSLFLFQCLDWLWAYGTVVDADVVDQAGEIGSRLNSFTGADVQAAT